MKERPIIFSGPMVRAVLEGRKTQTRRVVKPQPRAVIAQPGEGRAPSWAITNHPPKHTGVCVNEHGNEDWLRSPYGSVGDRLWVRETHAQFQVGEGLSTPAPQCVAYRATCDDKGGFDYVNGRSEVMHLNVTKWSSSIHMPRWASRITLEITAVRVERLQAMEAHENDFFAEGFEHGEPTTETDIEMMRGTPTFELAQALGVGSRPTAKFLFLCAWDDLNERRGYSWHSNPWVWVIEFEKIAENKERLA